MEIVKSVLQKLQEFLHLSIRKMHLGYQFIELGTRIR